MSHKPTPRVTFLLIRTWEDTEMNSGAFFWPLFVYFALPIQVENVKHTNTAHSDSRDSKLLRSAPRGRAESTNKWSGWGRRVRWFQWVVHSRARSLSRHTWRLAALMLSGPSEAEPASQRAKYFICESQHPHAADSSNAQVKFTHHKHCWDISRVKEQ